MIGSSQENFTIKIVMTDSERYQIVKSVKIVLEAEKRLGGMKELHEMLIREGVSISRQALYDMRSGRSQSLKPNVICALNSICFKGDWGKTGRLLDADFLEKREGGETANRRGAKTCRKR